MVVSREFNNTLCRNKRSLAIDLRHPEGVKVVWKLCHTVRHNYLYTSIHGNHSKGRCTDRPIQAGSDGENGIRTR